MKIHHGLTKDIWPVMLDACRKATKSIWFEQYLIGTDESAKTFIDVLCEKAKQGIEVRCLFDALGSFALGRSPLLLQKMQEAGVRIHFFNWLKPFSHHNQKFLYFRNHRRMLIIDEETAWTGGICIDNETAQWQDTQVEVTGPVVLQMKEVFLRDWFGTKYFKKQGKKKEPAGAEGLYFFTSTPFPRRRYLYYRLISAIRQAKTYIYLTTPYFLPDHKLSMALKDAVKRGVEVKLLIPGRSNHPIVNRGSQTYYEDFLLHGVKIFLSNIMVHDKTGAIDDIWGTVGSLNLDNVSLRYNIEGNIVSTDSRFALQIKANFEKDLENAKLLTLEEWRKRSYVDQWLELLVFPIRKLL